MRTIEVNEETYEKIVDGDFRGFEDGDYPAVVDERLQQRRRTMSSTYR